MNPLTFTPSRKPFMDDSIGIFHPRLYKKTKVENPSNVNFYRLCLREREVKSWGNVRAFR